MTNLPEPLTERQRTVLEMRAAGYEFHEISSLISEPDFSASLCMSDIVKKMGATDEEHAIALAIRGGHIL